MRRKVLTAALLCTFSISAFSTPASATSSAIPTVNCSGCTSLREFATYGAASLYMVNGWTAVIFTDFIWVHNPTTGRRALVDLDATVLGTIVTPWGAATMIDFSRLDVYAEWSDGSANLEFTTHREVIAAIAASIRADFQAHGHTYDLPVTELALLPEFNGAAWNHGPSSHQSWLTSGAWGFTVSGHGTASPIITVTECYFPAPDC